MTTIPQSYRNMPSEEDMKRKPQKAANVRNTEEIPTYSEPMAMLAKLMKEEISRI